MELGNSVFLLRGLLFTEVSKFGDADDSITLFRAVVSAKDAEQAKGLFVEGIKKKNPKVEVEIRKVKEIFTKNSSALLVTGYTINDDLL